MGLGLGGGGLGAAGRQAGRQAGKACTYGSVRMWEQAGIVAGPCTHARMWTRIRAAVGWCACVCLNTHATNGANGADLPCGLSAVARSSHPLSVTACMHACAPHGTMAIRCARSIHANMWHGSGKSMHAHEDCWPVVGDAWHQQWWSNGVCMSA